ncbi:MAG: NAD(P)-dependent oxidoreductase [bacterium]|nr:NAD(P)-dependent oxidoreductase [bacterium]MDE0353291.1 NAD(P)-dependent oxidoreductase [bacterium]
MKVGFIGLGNVGSKLSKSLLRNGFEMVVRDLDRVAAQPLLDGGAGWADTNRELAEACDLVITCLPSPAAVRSVMEGPDGVLEGLGDGKIWLEMSTTDEAEVRRLGALVVGRGARPMDGPVSGGCHRAATGNISIFVGAEREDFERALPVLTTMGRRILHVGGLGSASILKVVTNYLASVHLVALGEALMVAHRSGTDLNTTYEAIRISSGNSFVHETESQVILNGSYNINFTMDLVVKDMSLFQQLADHQGTPLELSPMVLDIFRRGEQVYGSRAWSSGIVRFLEDACGVDLRAPGFPEEIVDTEPEQPGYEVVPSVI